MRGPYVTANFKGRQLSGIKVSLRQSQVIIQLSKISNLIFVVNLIHGWLVQSLTNIQSEFDRQSRLQTGKFKTWTAEYGMQTGYKIRTWYKALTGKY